MILKSDINFTDYYANLAQAVAMKSKDPSSKVGCVLVNKHREIVSQGYNGLPSSIPDYAIFYERPIKYSMVIHAERNAIRLARGRDLSGGTAFVTHTPCPKCLVDLIAEKIALVIVLDEGLDITKRFSQTDKQAIVNMIDTSGIKVVTLGRDGPQVDIRFYLANSIESNTDIDL